MKTDSNVDTNILRKIMQIQPHSHCHQRLPEIQNHRTNVKLNILDFKEQMVNKDHKSILGCAFVGLCKSA